MAVEINLLPKENRPKSASQIINATLSSIVVAGLYALFSPLIIPEYVIERYLKLTAEKRLKKRIRSNPSDISLYCDLGDYYKSKGDFERANTQFMTALAINRLVTPGVAPHEPWNWGIRRGRAYAGMAECAGNLEERFEYLQKAFKIDAARYSAQRLLDAATKLATSYGMANPEEAAYWAVFDAVDVRAFDEDLPDYWKNLHQRYINRCEIDFTLENAAEFYREAMKENTKAYREFFIDVLRRLGYSEEEIEKEMADSPETEEDSLEGCGSGLNTFGKMLLAGAGKGKSLEDTVDEVSSAIQDFEQRVDKDPFNPELLAEYATYLVDHRAHIDKGFLREKLKELLERDPLNPRANYEYGRHLSLRHLTFRDPEYREFIRSLSIAFNDRDFEASYWFFYRELAYHYFCSDDYGKAAIVLERGLKASPYLSQRFGESLSKLDLSDLGCALKILPGIKDGFGHNFAEILGTQAIVKSGEFQRLLGIGKDDMDFFLRGVMSKSSHCRHILEQIEEAKQKVDKHTLARKLISLGLYDEAIQILEDSDLHREKELLLGEAYESKWMKEGKREFLEKAYAAYSVTRHWNELRMSVDYIADYVRVECTKNLERLARVAKLLGKDDEVRGIWEDAEGIANDSCAEVMETIRRYTGISGYGRKKLAEALRETDLEIRIGMLKKLDAEVPDVAKAELGRAYAEYAPTLAREIRELALVR